MHEDTKTQVEILKNQLESVTKDRHRLKTEAEDWERAHDNLTGRVTAEIASAEMSRAKAESLQKENVSLRGQIEELREAQIQSIAKSEEFQVEVSTLKLNAVRIQKDLESALEKAQTSAALKDELAKKSEVILNKILNNYLLYL